MEGTAQQYNRQPLAHCDGYYLGRSTPSKSIKFPDILVEPLTNIYSECQMKRKDLLQKNPVKIIIYSSGIIIKEGKTVRPHWYPIQNLYCSAGVMPDKTKAGNVEFKQLHEKVKSSSKKHPIFAMVVRQPGDDGRRVLMCHAFQVDSPTLAQRLVNSTQFAYKNKAGWNHPINDKEFLNAKTAYTLQHLQDGDGESIDELKTITEQRDKLLRQQPGTQPMQPQPVTKQRARSAGPQVRVRSIQSAPATPRLAVAASPRAQSVIVGSRGPMVITPRPGPSRVPTQRAVTYYRGFHTDTLQNGTGDHVVKSASIGGFPLSRSSSNNTGAMSLQPSAFFTVTGNGQVRPMNGQKSKRQMSGQLNPRGHRVLASSEPHEAVNGYTNGGQANGTGTPLAVVDWNSIEDEPEPHGNSSSPTLKVNGHSKHHRPSKKKMEKYFMNGDVNGNVTDGRNGKDHSSGNSERSDSSYSITKVDIEQVPRTLNGFFQAHEHADQAL